MTKSGLLFIYEYCSLCVVPSAAGAFAFGVATYGKCMRQNSVDRAFFKKYWGRSRELSRSTQDSNLEPPDDNNDTEMKVFRSQVRYPITPADPLMRFFEKHCSTYAEYRTQTIHIMSHKTQHLDRFQIFNSTHSSPASE